MANQKPIQDFAVLGRIDQIGTLAHEARLAILARLHDEPKTGADVARDLGLPANRVHYHLKRLVDQGLVEEVGKGRKRWKEERLYLARARHFLVDPGIGVQDEGTSRSLRQSIESAFLDWRREELLQVDLAEIAHRLVHRGLMAKPGDNVLVMHGQNGFDLAEMLFVELQAADCRGFSRLWSRHTAAGILNRHDEQALRDFDFVAPAITESLDGVIFISSSMPEGPAINPAQASKLPLLLDSVSRWQKRLRARKVRYVEFALPFRKEFERGEFVPEQAIDIFWRCVETEPATLARRAERLLACLDGNPRLELSCALGTKLGLELDLERSFVLDGVVCPDDVGAGRYFEGIPAGTLNFFPRPGTAEGIFRADYTFQGGAHVESVFLTLKQGRIVELRAEQNEDMLRQRLADAVGDADLLSGIRFGLNPAGRGPTGKPILDACLVGAVTLHFGNNELQGGDVRSTLDLVMPACHLSVRSGDTLIVDAGRLHPRILDA